MAQARTGNLNRQHVRAIRLGKSGNRLGRCLGHSRGGGFHAANDAIGIGAIGTSQLLNRRLHPGGRMLGQELQHADVLPHARAGAVPLFQALAQLAKHRRQLPIAVHIRMIQSGSAAF